MEDDLLLDVHGLKKYFPVKKGLLRRTVAQLKAVDGVDRGHSRKVRQSAWSVSRAAARRPWAARF